MAAAAFIGLFASLTGLSSLLIAAISVEIIEVQLLSTLNLVLAGAVVVLPDVAPAVSTRPERKEFVSVGTLDVYETSDLRNLVNNNVSTM